MSNVSFSLPSKTKITSHSQTCHVGISHLPATNRPALKFPIHDELCWDSFCTCLQVSVMSELTSDSESDLDHTVVSCENAKAHGKTDLRLKKLTDISSQSSSICPASHSAMQSCKNAAMIMCTQCTKSNLGGVLNTGSSHCHFDFDMQSRIWESSTMTSKALAHRFHSEFTQISFPIYLILTETCQTQSCDSEFECSDTSLDIPTQRAWIRATATGHRRSLLSETLYLTIQMNISWLTLADSVLKHFFSRKSIIFDCHESNDHGCQ